MTKNIGKTNRNKGNSYERSIAKEWRDLGWDKTVTARSESKNKDNEKVDLCYTEPFNVQCKNSIRSVNYSKILSEMPNDSNVNVVFHKFKSNQYVILKKEDFYNLIKKSYDKEMIKLEEIKQTLFQISPLINSLKNDTVQKPSNQQNNSVQNVDEGNTKSNT